MHKWFRIRVAAIILLVLSLLFAIGFYGFNRFNGIISALNKGAIPDKYEDMAKSLVADSYQAENAIKTYRLTLDSNYTNQFYSTASSADESLEGLYSLAKNDERIDEIRLLDSLMGEKYLLLHDLLNLSKVFRVQNVLNQLSNDFSSITTTNIDTLNPKASPKNRVGVVAKLFKRFRKSKNDTSEVALETKITENVKLEDLNQTVNKVKWSEYRIEEKIKTQEIAITQEIYLVDQKLSSLLNKLKANEAKHRLELTKSTEKSIQKTQNRIIWFAVFTALLIMVLTYLLASYIKASRNRFNQLKLAKEQTEKLAIEKERFLSKISHEIRTPLHVIGGYADELNNVNIKGQERTHNPVEMIQKSSAHLRNILNDFLDLTKLNARKLSLNIKPFSPYKIIEESLESIQVMIHEKQSLKQQNYIDQNIVLDGDPHRLNQILLNVLSNAQKYCPEGKITFESNIKNQGDQYLLKLEVIDEGIGMSKGQINKVFAEFEQANEGIAEEFGGTGLGLPIVKELIDLHGGNISISSKPNEGTKVSIEIPYQISQSELKPEQNKTENNINAEDQLKRILVVDDEDYNLKLISNMLNIENYELVLCRNGEQALSELYNSKFDLVLSDLRMPEMDGFALIRNIKSSYNKQVSSTRIIVVSAEVKFSLEDDLKKEGVEILPKPFNKQELIQAIENQNFTKNKIKSTPSNPDLSVNFTELREMSAGNDEFYIDMLQSFIKSTKSGLEEIYKYLEIEDYYMVGEYAHKLCSPCRHLACDKLLNYFKEIEKSSEIADQVEIKKTLELIDKEFKEVTELIEQEIDLT